MSFLLKNLFKKKGGGGGSSSTNTPTIVTTPEKRYTYTEGDSSPDIYNNIVKSVFTQFQMEQSIEKSNAHTTYQKCHIIPQYVIKGAGVFHREEDKRYSRIGIDEKIDFDFFEDDDNNKLYLSANLHIQYDGMNGEFNIPMLSISAPEDQTIHSDKKVKLYIKCFTEETYYNLLPTLRKYSLKNRKGKDIPYIVVKVTVTDPIIFIRNINIRNEMNMADLRNSKNTIGHVRRTVGNIHGSGSDSGGGASGSSSGNTYYYNNNNNTTITKRLSSGGKNKSITRRLSTVYSDSSDSSIIGGGGRSTTKSDGSTKRLSSGGGRSSSNTKRLSNGRSSSTKRSSSGRSSSTKRSSRGHRSNQH